MTQSLADIVVGDRLIEGTTLADRIDRAAGMLHGLGVRAGDVVALLLRNDVVFLEAMFAARRLGAYSCPINWHFPPADIAYILSDSGATVLVGHADLLAGLRTTLDTTLRVLAATPSPEVAAAHRLSPDACRTPDGLADWDTAVADARPYDGPSPPPGGNMPYTSGTTGRPKGVRRASPTPEHLARMAAMTETALGITPGVRTGATGPLYHTAPNTHVTHAMLRGERVVLFPRFDAAATLAAIERHRLTNIYLVPTMFVRLLALPEAERRRHDLSSLRFVASTGAPCPPAVKRAMIDWLGPIINETYAGSETGYLTAVSSEEWLARPGTAGRAIAGATVRIYADDGTVCPPGTPGTIHVRQDAYPDFTYVNSPEARRAVERDGLITMGDVGYLDEDGYLFICDRAADMVISGGVNIYPAQIEAALMTLPGIADCAVFGIPDAEFGEALAAAVQPEPGRTVTEEDVRQHLEGEVARYMIPKVVTFHASLPREDSGKIFKRVLRTPYWTQAGRLI